MRSIKSLLLSSLITTSSSVPTASRFHLHNIEPIDLEISKAYWTENNLSSAIQRGRMLPEDEDCKKLSSDSQPSKRGLLLENLTPKAHLGRLFMSFSDGPSYCMAAVIQSKTKSIIATAAHCLYDITLKENATHVVFVSGYASMTDHSLWPASSLIYETEFEKMSGTSEKDIAFVRVSTSDNDATGLQDHVSQTDSVPMARFDVMLKDVEEAEVYGQLEDGHYLTLDEPLLHCKPKPSGGSSPDLWEMNGCILPQGSSGGPFYFRSGLHGQGNQYQAGVLTEGSYSVSVTGEKMEAKETGIIVAAFSRVHEDMFRLLDRI